MDEGASILATTQQRMDVESRRSSFDKTEIGHWESDTMIGGNQVPTSKFNCGNH